MIGPIFTSIEKCGWRPERIASKRYLDDCTIKVHPEYTEAAGVRASTMLILEAAHKTRPLPVVDRSSFMVLEHRC